MNKREEFKCLLDKENPSLVFLVETKLNADIANMEIFDVNKYEVYRKDRVEQNAPGGGVAVLIKKSQVSTCNSIRFINHHAYAEAVWCEIKLEGNNILVGSVYRAPSSERDINNLQGSVLGPVLFLISKNDLISDFGVPCAFIC